MSTAKTPQQIQSLAKKSAWGAGILTLFIPPAGYLYTGRKQLAIIALVIWLPLIIVETESEVLETFLGFFMIGTTIENVIAIHRARGALKELNLAAEQQQETETLTVSLLKLAQKKGQITIADGVIETGKTAEEIRETLLDLERQDLVRSGNRESDGAVVYKLV